MELNITKIGEENISRNTKNNLNET